MHRQKVYGAIGLARRAGKCQAGDFAVERAVKSGKAQYVLIDSGASEATKKKYAAMADFWGVAYLELDGLGDAIGKPANKIAAIVDNSFAGLIHAAINAESKYDGVGLGQNQEKESR